MLDDRVRSERRVVGHRRFQPRPIIVLRRFLCFDTLATFFALFKEKSMGTEYLRELGMVFLSFMGCYASVELCF
jgi:hypothetical protein